MKDRAVVCVVGSFMYDLVATAPRRPEMGETLIGTSLETYLGGKGFNQAVAASRAGAATAMVGRVGADDFGREFLASLDTEGIEAAHVKTDPEHGTGVGLPVVQPDGQNSIIVIPRANQAVGVDDIAAARSVIEDASILLLQLELPPEPTLAAAQIAHEAGLIVVLNPAPFKLPGPQIARYVDVLVPNETELRALAALLDGSKGHPSLIAMAKAIRESWECTVVVTMGDEGAMLAPKGSEPVASLGAHSVEAVDTVGAGDIFCGNFGAMLAQRASLEEAVTFANAAAAIAVTRRGGAPAAPSRAETISRMDQAGRSSDSHQPAVRVIETMPEVAEGRL